MQACRSVQDRRGSTQSVLWRLGYFVTVFAVSSDATKLAG